MLVIELVSKWEIYWALWSLVVFDLDNDPTQNNVVWFLMGDFLRLSPWAQAVALMALSKIFWPVLKPIVNPERRM